MSEKQKKRVAKSCNCIALANKELARDGIAIDTDLYFDFDTKQASLKTYIPLRKIDSSTRSRVTLPRIKWTYCAICGKKLIP